MIIKSNFWEVKPLGLTHRTTFRSDLPLKGTLFVLTGSVTRTVYTCLPGYTP